jgi:hypothetical protein
MRRLALIAAVIGGLGCNDLATPADLARPQILAVRADPPTVLSGERTQLSIVLAGPDGFLAPAVTRWGIQPPGLGTLELEGDGSVFLRAPDELSAVEFTALEVSAEVDDETTLVAIKGIAMGVDTVEPNPTITDLRINGVTVDDGGSVELERGATITLDADTDPPPGQYHEFAWYSTSGEIDLWRLSPTDLIAPQEAEDGLLILVYRDGLGGVTWRSATISTP